MQKSNSGYRALAKQKRRIAKGIGVGMQMITSKRHIAKEGNFRYLQNAISSEFELTPSASSIFVTKTPQRNLVKRSRSDHTLEKLSSTAIADPRKSISTHLMENISRVPTVTEEQENQDYREEKKSGMQDGSNMDCICRFDHDDRKEKKSGMQNGRNMDNRDSKDLSLEKQKARIFLLSSKNTPALGMNISIL